MNIQETINYYKQNFPKCWDAENYKWVAVEHFQKNWDIEAPNFATMLENALSKATNLLSGPNYYPRGMIIHLAKVDPERVRRMFQNLYDEEQPLESRLQSFKKSAEELLPAYQKIAPDPGKAKSHYQDLRALCVYLSFKYPEKYYFYKYSMYQNFKEHIGFKEDSSAEDTDMRSYENFEHLCQKVLDEIKEDPELLEKQQAALEKDKGFYSDPEYHLLTQTIMYVDSYSQSKDAWWPTLEEYDPDLTAEQYRDLFLDEKVVERRWLTALYELYQMPGHQGSCKELGTRYGKTFGHYNSYLNTLAERIARNLGYEQVTKETSAKFWPILFQGKHVPGEKRSLYCYRMREQVQEAMEMLIEQGVIGEKPIPFQKKESEMITFDHNLILYGPPGTGKTYNSINYAVAIVEEKKVEEVMAEKYEDVLARYRDYKAQGRIEFTTFHQSYGYEEFIEGIRPVMGDTEEGNDLQYRIKPGIFKEFCERADRPVLKKKADIGLNANPTVWKVSLQGTGENLTRTECMENGHIRIGFDSYGENITDETMMTDGKTVLNAFISRMKIGDIVFSCYSATTIDAIGVVTGEYEWHDEYPEYKRLRKVNWLAKGLRENIVEMNAGKVMTLASTYALNSISVKDAVSLLEKVAPEAVMTEEKRPNYVFIIDEINRGNISKIFGELITLIEDSKRAGAEEAMEATLPYSGEKFSVPQNVYILGTMNTADRSIALMDTALRRRFVFKEIGPDSDILKKEGADKVIDGDQELDVAKMLDIMNKRIEFLYDREHKIGHAFFLKLKDDPSLEKLAEIFEKSIIPLLQEYFYEDYEKIQLVLGDNGKQDQLKFILDHPADPSKIFKGKIDVDIPEKGYEIQQSAFGNIESYRLI